MSISSVPVVPPCSCDFELALLVSFYCICLCRFQCVPALANVLHDPVFFLCHTSTFWPLVSLLLERCVSLERQKMFITLSMYAHLSKTIITLCNTVHDLFRRVKKQKLKWYGHVTGLKGLTKTNPAGHCAGREERYTREKMGE